MIKWPVLIKYNGSDELIYVATESECINLLQRHATLKGKPSTEKIVFRSITEGMELFAHDASLRAIGNRGWK